MSTKLLTLEQALFLTSTADILRAGKFCPYCYTKVQYYSQVGCCVYAVPCSCRQYCGTLDEPLKESQIFRHS